MKTSVSLFIIALAAFLLQPLHAQDSSGPVNPPAAPPPADVAPAPPPAQGNPDAAIASSASQAVQVAAQSVDASIRDRVVSIYGVGTPTGINRWWVIFYDPSVTSHGRAVRVENGRSSRPTWRRAASSTSAT
jgi:hypothetical protein